MRGKNNRKDERRRRKKRRKKKKKEKKKKKKKASKRVKAIYLCSPDKEFLLLDCLRHNSSPL